MYGDGRFVYAKKKNMRRLCGVSHLKVQCQTPISYENITGYL